MTEKWTTKFLFCKDLCIYTCTRSKNLHVHICTKSKHAHTHLCLMCSYFYMKRYKNCIDRSLLYHDLKFQIWWRSRLLLQRYLPNNTEHAQFHKDPFFCCGDICEIELCIFFGQHCIFENSWIFLNIISAVCPYYWSPIMYSSFKL